MKKVITSLAEYKIIPEQPTQNQNQNHLNKNPEGALLKKYEKIGKNL